MWAVSENTLLRGSYKRKRGLEVTGCRDCKERSSAAVRDEKEKSRRAFERCKPPTLSRLVINAKSRWVLGAKWKGSGD